MKGIITMKIGFSLAAAFAINAVLFGAPVVSNVNVSQSDCGLVTITYDLNEDAIITMDLQKDGERMSAAKLVGDVHKVVTAGNECHAYFRSDIVQKGALEGSLPNLTVNVKAWTTGAPPNYMSVDLGGTGLVRYYTSTNDLPYPVVSDHYRIHSILFRRIPAKDVTFNMGSPSGEANRKTNEDYHEVTLTNDYYIGVFPVTQGQWRNGISSDDASQAKGELTSTRLQHVDDGIGAICPVDNASSVHIWGRNSAVPGLYSCENYMWIWCLRSSTGLVRVRLPTEAEWEFACRAGEGDATYLPTSNIDNLAWHSGNSGGVTHPVGEKEPNAWGLYDMLGNVWEICADRYAASLGTSSQTAPFFPYQGTDKVCCGGGYDEPASGCRCARRGQSGPNYWAASGTENPHCGFRIVIDLN